MEGKYCNYFNASKSSSHICILFDKRKCTFKALNSKKLGLVISPYQKNCISVLLNGVTLQKIGFLDLVFNLLCVSGLLVASLK